MKKIVLLLLLCLVFKTDAIEDISWSLTDVNNQLHHFPADAQAEKQVTVLFFWASWCPYCQQLMPHIQSILYQYEEPLNLQVYALNIYEEVDPQDYLNSQGYRFLLFPKAESVAKKYQIHGTPGLLVFDQNGKKVFDLRDVDVDHLVYKSAKHSAKSVRLAPYWAAQMRKTLQQINDEL